MSHKTGMPRFYQLYKYTPNESPEERLRKTSEARLNLQEMEDYLSDFEEYKKRHSVEDIIHKFGYYDRSYSNAFMSQLLRDGGVVIAAGFEGVIIQGHDSDTVYKIEKPQAQKSIQEVKKYMNISRSINNLNQMQETANDSTYYDIGPTVLSVIASPFLAVKQTDIDEDVDYEYKGKAVKASDMYLTFSLIIKMKYYSRMEELDKYFKDNNYLWNKLTDVQKSGIVSQILMNMALINSDFISHCDLHLNNIMIVYDKKYKERVYRYREKSNPASIIKHRIKTDGYFVIFIDIGGFSSLKCDQESCRQQLGTTDRKYSSEYISNSSHYDSLSVGKFYKHIDPFLTTLIEIAKIYGHQVIGKESVIRTEKSYTICNQIEENKEDLKVLSDNIVSTMIALLQRYSKNGVILTQDDINVTGMIGTPIQDTSDTGSYVAGPSSSQRTPQSSLSSKSITELKDIAKKLGVKGYSKYTKATRSELEFAILSKGYRMSKRNVKKTRKTPKKSKNRKSAKRTRSPKKVRSKKKSIKRRRSHNKK
jgi:hypothetical protein